MRAITIPMKLKFAITQLIINLRPRIRVINCAPRMRIDGKKVLLGNLSFTVCGGGARYEFVN